jgi:hypothetical protein
MAERIGAATRGVVLALGCAACAGVACGTGESAAPHAAAPATPGPAADAPATAAGEAETTAPAAGPLAPLRAYVGRYPRDVGFFEQEPLRARLAALLGDRLPDFLENVGVQGPVSEEAGLLFVTGNRPHSGGDEAAAIVIDPASDAIFVWLLHEGAVTEHPEPGGRMPSALPADVQATLDNWYDTPAGE